MFPVRFQHPARIYIWPPSSQIFVGYPEAARVPSRPLRLPCWLQELASPVSLWENWCPGSRIPICCRHQIRRAMLNDAVHSGTANGLLPFCTSSPQHVRIWQMDGAFMAAAQMSKLGVDKIPSRKQHREESSIRSGLISLYNNIYI